MKKNLIKLFCMGIFLSVLFSSLVYGWEDVYVRVRVRYPRLFNEQVSFEGYEEILVFDEDDEYFTLSNKINLRIDTYYAGNYYITDENRAVFGPYHIQLNDKIYSSYEKANEKAKELKNEFSTEFYPYLTNEGYSICGGNFTDKDSLRNLIDQLSYEGYNAESFNGNLKNIIAYNEKNKPVFMYERDIPIYFSSYNEGEEFEMIKVDNKAYRGKFILIIEDYKLLTINYVELENYLYGVVPNEISASWGAESLKAQALAARTYAVSNIKPTKQYDMDDNQNSQVYMGYNFEKPSTTKAVDETKGEKIYYNNKLIQAFYHSTSGGKTEDSGNVWYETLPYLKGVDDSFTDYSGSPHNTWQSTYYKEDIVRKLNIDGNNVNDLYGIQIKSVSENNRVLECIFLTDMGEISYKKENLRLLLGLKSSWFTIENSNSFYFITEYFPDDNNTPFRGGILDLITDEIEENEGNIVTGKLPEMGSLIDKYAITDSGAKKLKSDKLAFISSKGISVVSTDSKQYNFEGRGWGHGIGMSQYGAKQMAEEGYTYIEILKHYYSGVTIK